MTVASATNRNDYVGNGSAETFAYSFKIFDQSHLLVTVKETATGEETTLTLTTQYTVTGVGETSGGSVVLVDDGSDWLDAGGDLDTGWELTIRRVVPLTQLTDIRNQGSFFPEAHEDQFDLLVMIDQQQQNELDRTPKFSETSDQTDIVIPEPEADKAWFWNALGTAIEYRSLTVTSGTFPGNFTAGVDASKAASPSTNDVYIATDTKILYVCFSSGTWTVISTLSGTDASKAASPKVGQVYLATDTGKVYFCFVAGTWTTALTLSNTLTMSGAAINTAKGSDIASATTTDIGAATGNFVDITGTTTITGLGTVQAGTLRAVRFSGALTLTHNATSLILPSGANITTASGDTALFVSLGSGNWRCLFYSKASGIAVVPFTPSASNALAGSIIQVRRYETGSMIDCANATPPPLDNTKPTSSEGDQIMTDVFTPLVSTSRIRITVEVNGCFEGTNMGLFWLLLGSDTEARKVGVCDGTPAQLTGTGTISFEYTPGSASQITAYVRAGQPSAGYHFTFNGHGAAQKMNGALLSSITWEEIKV